MNESKVHISKESLSKESLSKEQAMDSMEQVVNIQDKLAKNVRPPFWFMVIAPGSYGMATFSYAAMRHENNWALGIFAFLALFFICYFVLTRVYRGDGIRLRILPVSKSSVKLHFAAALFFGTVFLLSRELSVYGLEFVAYLAAVINSGVLALLLYYFPTGEVLEKGIE